MSIEKKHLPMHYPSELNVLEQFHLQKNSKQIRNRY